MGVHNICAVDGNEKRLEFAKRMGANTTVNFMNFKGIEALTEAVKEAQGGHLADFAFQCTGNPHAHSNIYKFIRNGGGLCELGFFINGGDATINRTSTSAPKRSTLLVPGYTTSETMQQHLISLREQKQSDFQCLS